MIRKLLRHEIPECVEVIRRSFQTVADDFGFTKDNASKFTAFCITKENLEAQMDVEHRPMYVYYDQNRICGYFSLRMMDQNECELCNLAVLPDFRHNGIGKKLLDYAFKLAKELEFKVVHINIVEENKVVRKWYEQNGAIHLSTKKYDFLSFTCGFMIKEI